MVNFYTFKERLFKFIDKEIDGMRKNIIKYPDGARMTESQIKLLEILKEEITSLKLFPQDWTDYRRKL